MVLAARDKASNSFSLGQATVDATADLKQVRLDSNIELDKDKYDASVESLDRRDAVVREGIERDYQQTLRNNEANLMLEPEAYPAYDNPKDYLKQYDEEGNEIGWGLPRPVYPKIPDVREIPYPAEVKSGRVPTGWAAAPGIIGEAAGYAAAAFTGIGALPNVSFGAGMVNATNILGTIGNTFGGGNVPKYTPMTIGQTRNNGNLNQNQFDLNTNFWTKRPSILNGI